MAASTWVASTPAVLPVAFRSRRGSGSAPLLCALTGANTLLADARFDADGVAALDEKNTLSAAVSLLLPTVPLLVTTAPALVALGDCNGGAAVAESARLLPLGCTAPLCCGDENDSDLAWAGGGVRGGVLEPDAAVTAAGGDTAPPPSLLRLPVASGRRVSVTPAVAAGAVTADALAGCGVDCERALRERGRGRLPSFSRDGVLAACVPYGIVVKQQT